MQLTFERGDPQRPKGHAIIYFKDRTYGRCYATYVIVLPFSVDIAKYVPPFLAGQIGSLSPKELSVFAFPPVPEEVESFGRLEVIATLRDDDILSGGQIDPGQVPNLLNQVNDMVQGYMESYSKIASTVSQQGVESPGGVGVEEVLYGLMGERDRLGELGKLIGKLRFALDGNDEKLTRDTEEEIRLLAKHLPERWKVQGLVEAVKSPSLEGTKLAQLYLERCYKLLDEDYQRLREVEDEIAFLEREWKGKRPSG